MKNRPLPVIRKSKSFSGFAGVDTQRPDPRKEKEMKKIRIKLSQFEYLQKTLNGILLKQEEILKAFSVLTTVLFVIYSILFRILGSVPAGAPAPVILLLPLMASAVLVIISYFRKTGPAMFLITWLLPGIIALVSYVDPRVNYSNIIIIYMLILLFLDNSKTKRLAGFLWQATAYSLVQYRYYEYLATHQPGVNTETIMLPVFCVVLFMILARIKKEFTLYQAEIRKQKDALKTKNVSLERLVTLSEEQSERLKRTVLLKEKLISIISHDIRLPFFSIRFLIDSFEKGYISEQALLNGIMETRNELMKMDNMIEDLVNWSRTGETRQEPSTISRERLNEIIESVLSIYTLCGKNKNITIIPVIEMGADNCLFIERRHIEIILRNLLSNAIKYSDSGGRILVSLRANPEIPRSEAVLTVKDFGCGIHPALLEKLNGNRVISTAGTLNEVGLGIGLSIVFDTINERNLHYVIKSDAGKGTEFEITIPLVSCGRDS